MKFAMVAILVLICSNFGYCDQKMRFTRIEDLAEQEVAEKLLTEIYHKSGIDIEITAIPGKRATVECLSGKWDGETARIHSYGEKHPELIRIPTPYSTLETTAFALGSKNISITSKQDLAQYNIAIIRGVQHTLDITEGLPNVTLINDCDTLVKFVRSGRADVMLTNTLTGIGTARRLRMKDVVVVGNLETLDLYHYVTRKNAALVPVIDATIRTMTASGELARLRSRYEGEYMMKLDAPPKRCGGHETLPRQASSDGAAP